VQRRELENPPAVRKCAARGRISVVGGAAVLLLGAGGLAACGQTAGSKAKSEDTGSGSVTGAGGSGTPDGASATTAAGQGGVPVDGSTTGGVAPTCDDAGGGLLPKRLTRLAFPQLANAIGQLFGDEIADEVRAEFELPGLAERAFPALAHASEGAAFGEQSWSKADAIAQRVGEHVLNEFASLTGCEASDTACSEAYLHDVAAEAYRRPLTSDEEASLAQLIDSLTATEASAAEMAQYGVYGLLSSPAFLYRTEFGADPEQAGPLAPAELADQLAYFLTDAPPDDELRELAEQGALLEGSNLEQQAVRLLGERSVQQNLSGALNAHFGLPNVEYVVIDAALAPTFDQAMRQSMRHEAEWFLEQLWQPEPFAQLLFGRRSFVDERLAAVYGIEFPPPDASVDADGFARVELPAERAGLLTLPAFLASSSRPDVASVVLRGLRVVTSFGCAAPAPGPPEDDMPSELPVGASQAEAAAIRAAEPACAQCHDAFDPQGLALQHFGLIGEYRDVDEAGEPIDSSATLSDGATVSGAAELGAHLAATDDFGACMSKAWLSYALQSVSETLEPCAYESIAQTFRASPGTLSDLLVAVATAPALRERSAPAQ